MPECRAIMVHVSTRARRTDANAIEVTKAQHVTDKSIRVRTLFATTKVCVRFNRIVNLCVNVHQVSADRIVMNPMVCVKKERERERAIH